MSSKVSGNEGVGGRAGIWPHLERGHGFWHLYGSGRSGYMTDPSTVSSWYVKNEQRYSPQLSESLQTSILFCPIWWGHKSPPPPSPLWIKRPEKCYARMLGRRKRRRGGSEKRKSTRVKMWGTFPLSSIPSPLLSSFPTPRVKGFVPLHSEIISCVRRRQGTNPKLFVFAGLSRFGLFVLTR